MNIWERWYCRFSFRKLGGNTNMKNRIICFALCLLLVLSVGLTGCKDKTSEEMIDNIVEEASANTKTLSMWLVTEEALSDSVKKSVNDAVNSITTSKFNIYLFINFLTEDEYYSKVSEEIRAYEDSKNSFGPVVEKTEGAPIIVGDHQFAKHYPALRENQVDIIYISGEDMYAEFVENGWLSSLDSELSSSSKKIKEHLSATLLEAAKIQKATYAIPNNKALGEYTLMLLDKKLMNENFMDGIYNQGKINGFFNDYIYTYLETVRSQYPDILPVDASYEDCLDLLAHYWSIDPDTYETQNDELSVLGYRYTDPASLSKGQTVLSFNSLFADEVFCENFVKLNEYRLDGQYFGEAAEGQQAAIRFVKGGYADYQAYSAESSEYYPVIVKYPTVGAEIYDSMVGVCSYSVDLSASMQIVTYLNTNADFRNLLQYGVLGEHYKLNEEGDTVERLTDEDGKLLYDMDIYKTGNAFIAYPEPEMSKDVWENAKEQNRQALLDPLLDFDFAALVEKSDEAAAENVKVGSSGYVYTYQSGYSKDVVSQNALLKKWIDSSDAAGKGVYVLHTGVLSGQNFSGKLYYYNNNITNATVTVTDGSGALTVKYEGTVGEGSDITVITFNGKKNSSNLAWNASVNGASADTKVTYQNSALNFNFFDTEYYTVDFDASITKAMVLENADIWNWIYAPTTAHSNDKPNVAVYASQGEGENAEGKYTYVVYMPTITNRFETSLQPTVSGTTLNLNVQYKTTSTALGEAENKYAMFLVNVDLKAPMNDVKFNLTVDGVAVTEENMVVTTLTDDPKIAISGTLDVELVKYIDELNANVNALLDACTTVEEFEKLVEDLHVLLTPKTVDEISGSGLKFAAFESEALNNYVSGLDAKEFYRMLSCATASDKVIHKHEVMDEDTGEMKLQETSKIGEIYPSYSGMEENYKYYSSPYALYMAWLKDNGYTK